VNIVFFLQISASVCYFTYHCCRSSGICPIFSWLDDAKKHFNKTLVSVVRFCLLVFIRSFLCCDKAAKITTQTYFVSTVMFC